MSLSTATIAKIKEDLFFGKSVQTIALKFNISSEKVLDIQKELENASSDTSPLSSNTLFAETISQPTTEHRNLTLTIPTMAKLSPQQLKKIEKDLTYKKSPADIAEANGVSVGRIYQLKKELGLTNEEETELFKEKSKNDDDLSFTQPRKQILFTTEATENQEELILNLRLVVSDYVLKERRNAGLWQRLKNS